MIGGGARGHSLESQIAKDLSPLGGFNLLCAICNLLLVSEPPRGPLTNHQSLSTNH